MELTYAIIHHDDDPEAWRWWHGVHEIFHDPETWALHWSERPITLVTHGHEGGEEALRAEVRRILAEVSERPILRATDLMAAGGRAMHNYEVEPPGRSSEVSPRLAAE